MKLLKKEPPEGWPGTEKRRRYNEARDRLRQRRRLERGEELIQCVECTGMYRNLSAHVLMRHKKSIREYLIEHKLPVGVEISAPSIHEQAKRHFDAHPEIKAAFKANRNSDEHLRILRDADSKTAKAAKIAESYRERPQSEAQKQNNLRLKTGPYVDVALATRRQRNVERGLRLKRICGHCGMEYDSKRSARTSFCSPECYRESRKGRPMPPKAASILRVYSAQSKAEREKRDRRICAGCGVEFVRHSGKANERQRFCSCACANANRVRDSKGRMI